MLSEYESSARPREKKERDVFSSPARVSNGSGAFIKSLTQITDRRDRAWQLGLLEVSWPKRQKLASPV